MGMVKLRKISRSFGLPEKCIPRHERICSHFSNSPPKRDLLYWGSFSRYTWMQCSWESNPGGHILSPWKCIDKWWALQHFDQRWSLQNGHTKASTWCWYRRIFVCCNKSIRTRQMQLQTHKRRYIAFIILINLSLYPLTFLFIIYIIRSTPISLRKFINKMEKNVIKNYIPLNNFYDYFWEVT